MYALTQPIVRQEKIAVRACSGSRSLEGTLLLAQRQRVLVLATVNVHVCMSFTGYCSANELYAQLIN